MTDTTEQPEIGNVVTGFSLADLAGLDTSDIAVKMNRLPLEGIYDCLLTVGALKSVGNDPTKPPLFQVKNEFEIMRFEPVKADPDLDPSRLVGKKLTDTSTLWPDQLMDEIGLLKGKYKRAGLATDGPFGGTEEIHGWVDAPAGSAYVRLKVRHFVSKGEEKAAIDWVGPVPDAQAA